MVSKSVFWVLLLVNEAFRGFSELREPTNVTITSVNLKSVLHWDASPDLQGPVNYHVEYKINNTDAKWTPVENCALTTRTECDFSVTIQPYYKNVVLQVRAENGNDTSAWVQSKAFNALFDTEIGPPTVSLDSQAGEIYVRFLIPGDAMKHYFTQWIHYVTYWKEGDNVKFVETTENFVQLKGVESGVRYCVRVKSQEYRYNPYREGISSPEKCIENTRDEASQVTSLVLILTATLTFACLLTAACFFVVRRTYGCAKDLLNPVWSVPEDIAEFLTRRSPGDSFTPPAGTDVPEEAIDNVLVLNDDDDDDDGGDVT